ncbi:MAG: class I SAM-dependent methyltransferase, partial [Gemmatimonadetes bacterium]|nr:class I SAM-dependent methyltransferase [Gemmatimonadota bacterium]
MSEYDRKDAGLYDSFSTGLEGDEAFYTEEATRVEGPVLELGCGTGRIMIPIAESGVSIVGLDRAPAMLEVARRKMDALPDETKRRMEIVEGDMRTFSLERRFPLAIMPYRAFLHMMSGEDQRR